MDIFLVVVAVLCSIALIVSVIMQSSVSAGMGAVGGAADTFFGKKSGLDGLFKKITIASIVLLFIVSIIFGLIG